METNSEEQTIYGYPELLGDLYQVCKHITKRIADICNPKTNSDIEASKEQLKKQKLFTNYVYVNTTEYETLRNSFIVSVNEVGVGLPIYIDFFNIDMSELKVREYEEYPNPDYLRFYGYISVEWNKDNITILVDCEKFFNTDIRQDLNTISNFIAFHIFKQMFMKHINFKEISTNEPFYDFMKNEFELETSSRIWILSKILMTMLSYKIMNIDNAVETFYLRYLVNNEDLNPDKLTDTMLVLNLVDVGALVTLPIKVNINKMLKSIYDVGIYNSNKFNPFNLNDYELISIIWLCGYYMSKHGCINKNQMLTYKSVDNILHNAYKLVCNSMEDIYTMTYNISAQIHWLINSYCSK